MAEVRCPKCGTAVPDGRRRTARCPACREAFGTCRYCRHYDSRAQDCAHLSHREIDHIVDPDEVVECPEFSSRLTAAPRRDVRALLRTALLSLIGFSALAGLAIYGARRSDQITPGQPLRVGVAAPEVVVQDEGMELTVTVVNLGERELKNVEVTVGGRGMRALVLQALTPPEAYLDSTANSVSAGAARLPSGTEAQFDFHFSPTRAGHVELLVSVTAASLQGAVTQVAESEISP